jgi:hypothetical protein
LEVPGIEERIILTWVFRKRDRGMDWINAAQDKFRLQALINAIMNLRVP